MGKDLVDNFVQARSVFSEASEAVGIDVGKLCFESDEETLRLTENAQLALFTCGMAAYRCISDKLTVEAFAGHSVGEYAAITAAGVLSVSEGAKLVRRRGELMAMAKSGAMAAVLGLDRETLRTVCEEASSADGIAVIANDNCPGQLVISGDKSAVEAAGKLAVEKGAKRVLPLNVGGAFHSPLMTEAAREMAVALGEAPFGVVPQEIDVYANVTGGKIQHAREWPELLARQLESPVRWTESVQAMVANGITTFIECGAGEVLCGLIRRIEPTATTIAINDAASLSKLEQLVSK